MINRRHRGAIPLLLGALLLLSGCGSTLDLGPEWSPLEEVRERPSLPLVGDGTTSTVGRTVYVRDLGDWAERYPEGSAERTALLRHEQVHARRQLKRGVASWVASYLTSADRMWREEREGWRAEIEHLRAMGAWRHGRLERVARSLAGYRTLLGQRMVSEGAARAWVLEVLRGR